MTIRERIGTELAALYKTHGGLTPQGVVKWARANKSSALHSRFEWDNSKAAEQYRLWQARELIVEVEAIYPDGKKRQVYVSPLSVRGTVGYQTLVGVLSHTERRAEFLAQALDEYQRVGAKFLDLQELAGVRAAVDAASRRAHRPRRKQEK